MSRSRVFERLKQSIEGRKECEDEQCVGCPRFRKTDGDISNVNDIIE